MSIFTEHNKEENADLIARKLPNGQAFCAKYVDGTNIRKWLLGLSVEFTRMEVYLNYVYDQLQLTTTSDLIDEFEADYAMNSNCFKTRPKDLLPNRVNDILTLIKGNGTTTKEDFELIAECLGIDANITDSIPSGAGFPYEFPLLFSGANDDDRFIMYVELQQDEAESFPYTFPFVLSGDPLSIMICFFEELKPSNTRIVYYYSP